MYKKNQQQQRTHQTETPIGGLTSSSTVAEHPSASRSTVCDIQVNVYDVTQFWIFPTNRTKLVIFCRVQSPLHNMEDPDLKPPVAMEEETAEEHKETGTKTEFRRLRTSCREIEREGARDFSSKQNNVSFFLQYPISLR